MFYVYKITNKVNGKVYIGKSGELEKSWRTHLAIAARGNQDPSFSIIHAAIRKYGEENFCFEIIESLDSEQESFDREAYWIADYKTNIYKYGSTFGYNLSDGGEGQSGFRFSEEQKKKMSEIQSGTGNGFYGKTHTEEVKGLLSKKRLEYHEDHPNAFLGKKHSAETKKLMSENRAEKFDFYSELNAGSKIHNLNLMKMMWPKYMP